MSQLIHFLKTTKAHLMKTKMLGQTYKVNEKDMRVTIIIT